MKYSKYIVNITRTPILGNADVRHCFEKVYLLTMIDIHSNILKICQILDGHFGSMQALKSSFYSQLGFLTC